MDGRRIGGGTRIVAILGRPVAASRSPVMQNAAFAALGLDWRYLAFEVGAAQLRAALAGARALGFAGLNITAPHKQAAAGLMDRLAGAARSTGMVNTVSFTAAGLTGDSTDGAGFLDAARDQGWAEFAGAGCVVLGAGGAGVSVAAALAGEGARVTVLNRSPERLHAALERLAAAGAPRPRGSTFDGELARTALAGAEVVVNCLPPAAGVPPVDPSAMPAGVLACDLAYEPAEPPFLLAMRGRAERRWNGLGMLVHQGARSLTLWSGREAPLAVMAAAVGYRLPPPAAR